MLNFNGNYKLNIILDYIYKSDCQTLQFHFFPMLPSATFVSSCEFNGLVSKSCRIPPAALFFICYLKTRCASTIRSVFHPYHFSFF